ncbi:MAG TPA: PPE family protein [Mycobacterium sp.]|nr:PPE family protein [Mycobacterium sp.]
MTAPIFMAAPPEVHSALLSSGPGPGSLLAAAQAWNSLSVTYTETANELTAVLEAVQAGTWDGPSSEAYVAAHVPYLAWLTQASADSAATAAQQEVAATAYTTALAAMPTLPELAANHITHGVLLATNFLGINTIPIALNETDYARMWVQAATVMGTYQTIAGAAVAASPQTTPAPQVVKANSAASTADSTSTLPPDTEQQWMDWLQQIGYTDFYNNVLQPIIDYFDNNPFLLALFTQIDPFLPELGNPLSFLSPFNVAFALGYPLDIGSYVAFLSETFSFIGGDITAAFATGSPYAIGLTLVLDTVEAIGTIITDTIALLKTLLESVVLLIPTVLPLLTVPLIPLAAAPLAGFAGLAGLAGLAAIPPLPIPPLPMPLAMAAPPPGPTPVPTPAPAPAPAPAQVVTSAPVHTPPPPPPTPAGPPLATMQGYLYMVGVLSASARRAASQAAKTKEAQPAEGSANPAAATAPKKTPGGRRRRSTVERPGRGYEYIDLDDEPIAYPSTHGSGPLGFSGTATKVSAGAATGLATLAEDDFGSSPRMPMMPSTWGNDSPELPDDE